MVGGAWWRARRGVACARGALGKETSSIPGAEFQKANDLIRVHFHANPNGAPAQIVFVAPQGQKVTAAHYQPVIDEVAAEAARSPQVASSDTPQQSGQVSRDGSTAIADVQYKAGGHEFVPL
ncbi:MMPL family transporter [Streptomyces sp. NPDC020917]|uniref:MMPL family transporter n=1 Tax=Streptomyces sp. NPDC020917 TaxID=3365102 RepID=UPI0037918B57